MSGSVLGLIRVRKPHAIRRFVPSGRHAGDVIHTSTCARAGEASKTGLSSWREWVITAAAARGRPGLSEAMNGPAGGQDWHRPGLSVSTGWLS